MIEGTQATFDFCSMVKWIERFCSALMDACVYVYVCECVWNAYSSINKSHKLLYNVTKEFSKNR